MDKPGIQLLPEFSNPPLFKTASSQHELSPIVAKANRFYKLEAKFERLTVLATLTDAAAVGGCLPRATGLLHDALLSSSRRSAYPVPCGFCRRFY
jgi:hypothetical protein